MFPFRSAPPQNRQSKERRNRAYSQVGTLTPLSLGGHYSSLSSSNKRDRILLADTFDPSVAQSSESFSPSTKKKQTPSTTFAPLSLDGSNGGSSIPSRDAPNSISDPSLRRWVNKPGSAPDLSSSVLPNSKIQLKKSRRSTRMSQYNPLGTSSLFSDGPATEPRRDNSPLRDNPQPKETKNRNSDMLLREASSDLVKQISKPSLNKKRRKWGTKKTQSFCGQNADLIDPNANANAELSRSKSVNEWLDGDLIPEKKKGEEEKRKGEEEKEEEGEGSGISRTKRKLRSNQNIDKGDGILFNRKVFFFSFFFFF